MFFPHFPSSIYFLKQPDWFPTLEKLIQLQETFISGKTKQQQKKAGLKDLCWIGKTFKEVKNWSGYGLFENSGYHWVSEAIPSTIALSLPWGYQIADKKILLLKELITFISWRGRAWGCLIHSTCDGLKGVIKQLTTTSMWQKNSKSKFNCYFVAVPYLIT